MENGRGIDRTDEECCLDKELDSGKENWKIYILRI